MAKFNRNETGETLNRELFPAFPMADKEKLVTAVLTTMFGEPKFYGSTDGDIYLLAVRCAAADPGFLCRLACYTRNVFQLRSVSHVLVCVIAREARKYTRPAIRHVVVRPDDITEIMACWLQMYGKPFPNAMKREIARVIQRFDAEALAKYDSRKQLIRFRDVLRITHPKPADPEKEAIFRMVMDETLPVPYTWETELSARGNTAEVWNELIASGRVGYMALLRNLRNILLAGADVGPVLKTLSDPEQVRRSRQLPFRFFSAYRSLPDDVRAAPEVRDALEKAINVSLERMVTIPGRTLIAVDVSGSMGSFISRRSTVQCRDIASLIAAMAGRICEEGVVCYFDCTQYSCLPEKGKGYLIEQPGRDDPILETCMKHSFRGGGTQMDLPMLYALEAYMNDADGNSFDRVIYLSDNQCNLTCNEKEAPVQKLVDQYRKLCNPDFWVHAVDLQGYGTQQFNGDKFNLITGWSERVLTFINMAEQGIGTQVKAIEEYAEADL